MFQSLIPAESSEGIELKTAKDKMLHLFGELNLRWKCNFGV